MWFSDSLGGGCQSLVAHGHLLRKNVFPMIVLPLQPILTGMVQFAIAFGIFLVLRVIFFGPPGWVALALPLAVVLQLAFTVGLVQIFAIIHVFWRDMGQLLTSILMLWLWLTPIFYLPIFFAGPIREAFGQWAYDAILWMFWINPFYHIAALYQRLLFFTATPEWQPRVWISIVYLAILSGVLWFVARRLFGRAQARVVEMV
jgi:lipopolysaccharide transport system permease protein